MTARPRTLIIEAAASIARLVTRALTAEGIAFHADPGAGRASDFAEGAAQVPRCSWRSTVER